MGEIFQEILRKIERLRLQETKGFGRQVMHDSSFGCSMPLVVPIIWREFDSSSFEFKILYIYIYIYIYI